MRINCEDANYLIFKMFKYFFCPSFISYHISDRIPQSLEESALILNIIMCDAVVGLLSATTRPPTVISVCDWSLVALWGKHRVAGPPPPPATTCFLSVHLLFPPGRSTWLSLGHVVLASLCFGETVGSGSACPLKVGGGGVGDPQHQHPTTTNDTVRHTCSQITMSLSWDDTVSANVVIKSAVIAVDVVVRAAAVLLVSAVVPLCLAPSAGLAN